MMTPSPAPVQMARKGSTQRPVLLSCRIEVTGANAAAAAAAASQMRTVSSKDVLTRRREPARMPARVGVVAGEGKAEERERGREDASGGRERRGEQAHAGEGCPGK